MGEERGIPHQLEVQRISGTINGVHLFNVTLSLNEDTSKLVTTPTTSLLEGVATLTDVNLFQNCSTSVEVTCTVSSGDSTGFCFTDPLVPINRPGVRHSHLPLTQCDSLYLGNHTEHELSTNYGDR